MFEALLIALVVWRLFYRAEEHEGPRNSDSRVQKTPRKL